MKKLFVVLAVLGISTIAQADGVKLNVRGLTGIYKTDKGIGRVYVTVTDEGKIGIESSDQPKIEAEAKVVSDARPVDGALTLQVGNAQLLVGSGESPDGTISYTLVLGNSRIELKPLVDLQLIANAANPKGYQCLKVINCMPIVAPNMIKYCSDDYAAWAKKNCAVQPQRLD